MSGNDNWVKKEILPVLRDGSQERIKGYFCRRLNTAHENYAHIFLCEMKDENDLVENWNNVINLVAVHVQSEVVSLLQRSNFYVWLYCGTKVRQKVQKGIEDDTFSSKKYVVVEESRKSEQERIEIIERKLFSFEKYVEPEIKSSMIRKVVIRNFRTYKGERIFDFSYGKKPARLVVLFAPNGMGKTSFFDGVEWAFTETVDRFAKIGNKSVDGVILKNTEAGQEEEASVTVHMENSEWVKRKVSELNNKTKKDTGKGNVSFSKGCNLKEVVGDNKAWSNLILQHHKIDGFIAAANPQELYKEWCGLWDSSGEERGDFENSHKAVKDRKKDLESAVKKYEQIKAEYDELSQKRNFVEKLGEDITKFNRLLCGDKLKMPDFSVITQDGYRKWSNNIEQKMDDYRVRNEKLKEAVSYIETRFEEDVNNYIRLSEQRKTFDTKVSVLEERIERCQKKREVLKLQADFEGQKTSIEEDLKRLYSICSDRNWYEQARGYFEALPKQTYLQEGIREAKDALSLLVQDLERLRVDLQNADAVFKGQEEYKQLCTHLDEISKLEKERKELEEGIATAEKQILIKTVKISQDMLKQENMRKKYYKSFDVVYKRYHSLDLQQEDEDIRLENIRAALIEELEKYSKLENEIQLYEQWILEEENIGKRLGQILDESRKLIRNQNLDRCPVCHTLFEDPDMLIQQTYYSDSVEGEKLKQKQGVLRKELNGQRGIIEQCMEEYNSQVGIIIAEIESEIISEKKLADDIRKSCEKDQVLVEQAGDAVSQISKEDQERGIYVVYSDEGIESWHDNWSRRQRAEMQLLEKQIEETDVKVGHQREKIALLEKELREREEVILNMESSSQESFALMQKEEECIVKNTYDELRKLVDEKERERKILSDKLKKCSMDLELYNDVSEILQQNFVERKGVLLEEIKNNYEETSFVVERIRKSAMLKGKNEGLEALLSSDWKSMAKQMVEQLRSEQDNVRKATEILYRVRYNREVEDYIRKNKEIEQQLKQSEKEKREKEEQAVIAEEEYQVSKNRIEKNFRRFFEGYQVNNVYEKLEPHQTFKTLTCEFGFNGDDKPEMAFKVVGKDGELYAPEWYFSTAQLNAVAFSVFLGKALQIREVPVQSILIDDPVGHFDDMNIVCFVDLLRNIVENTERQLIISTHEERIFALIQRKLPRDEYPVCYIDFRSDFGV